MKGPLWESRPDVEGRRGVEYGSRCESLVTMAVYRSGRLPRAGSGGGGNPGVQGLAPVVVASGRDGHGCLGRRND